MAITPKLWFFIDQLEVIEYMYWRHLLWWVVTGCVYSYYSVIVIENRPIGPKSPVKHRNA